MAALRGAIAVSARQGAWIRLVTGDLANPEGMNRQALGVLVNGVEGGLIRQRIRVLTASAKFPALLHAKIVVADGERGYLGSANISGRALDENFEVGTALVKDQARALDGLVAYLEAQGLLIDRTEAVFGFSSI
jgi:phosphatidylserine/phosphatidylglycerophosphate/cardiolipin synthase-like enzyme